MGIILIDVHSRRGWRVERWTNIYANDAIAEHNQTCDCKINWENTKTLATEPFFYRRKVREALEIRRLKTGPGNPNGLNRDHGDYVTTNTWQSLFDKINTNKKISMETFESMTSDLS